MKKRKSEAVRTVIETNVEEKRDRERPKKKCSNAIVSHKRTTGVCVVNVGHRVKWSFRTWMTNPKCMLTEVRKKEE